MICFTLKPSQSFFVYHIQIKENFFYIKELFKKNGEWRIEQKTKRRLFNCSHYDPTTLIRKYANELRQELNKI